MLNREKLNEKVEQNFDFKIFQYAKEFLRQLDTVSKLEECCHYMATVDAAKGRE